MDPFIGQIMMFGGNFAPRGWAKCDGQLLPISAHSALFSILGTKYGGDGRTTFGLPDLRGRFPLHPGNGPGLPSYQLGQKGGTYQVQLNTNNLPSHNHTIPALTGTSTVPCVEDDGTSSEAGGNNIANAENSENIYSPNNADGTMKNSGTVTTNASNTGNQGGNAAFSIQNPYQGINFVIALEGIYPSRS